MHVVRFSEEPIDPAQVYELMETSGTGEVGSVVLHFAVVKSQTRDGKVTAGIEYRAQGDVEQDLESIVATLKGRWQLSDVVVLRRKGRVGIGEIISLVAAGSPHSQDAFQACQFGIENFKQMASIHKTELYE